MLALKDCQTIENECRARTARSTSAGALAVNAQPVRIVAQRGETDEAHQ